jgi:hypothetical protein
VINFPFNPADFLRIAENLSNGRDESYFRTSVSRSYYSVFLNARETLERKTGRIHVERPGDIHEEIILKLKALRLWHIADKLDQLRALRRRSDYFLNVIVDQRMARKALDLARYAQSKVQEDLA